MNHLGIFICLSEKQLISNFSNLLPLRFFSSSQRKFTEIFFSKLNLTFVVKIFILTNDVLAAYVEYFLSDFLLFILFSFSVK